MKKMIQKITFSVDEEMKDWLTDRAENQDVTISCLLRRIIKREAERVEALAEKKGNKR